VTHAEVMRAIEEDDRPGPERHFAAYGFGRASTYALRHGGRSSDSTAISPWPADSRQGSALALVISPVQARRGGGAGWPGIRLLRQPAAGRAGRITEADAAPGFDPAAGRPGSTLLSVISPDTDLRAPTRYVLLRPSDGRAVATRRSVIMECRISGLVRGSRSASTARCRHPDRPAALASPWLGTLETFLKHRQAMLTRILYAAKCYRLHA